MQSLLIFQQYHAFFEDAKWCLCSPIASLNLCFVVPILIVLYCCLLSYSRSVNQAASTFFTLFFLFFIGGCVLRMVPPCPTPNFRGLAIRLPILDVQAGQSAEYNGELVRNARQFVARAYIKISAVCALHQGSATRRPFISKFLFIYGETAYKMTKAYASSAVTNVAMGLSHVKQLYVSVSPALAAMLLRGIVPVVAAIGVLCAYRLGMNSYERKFAAVYRAKLLKVNGEVDVLKSHFRRARQDYNALKSTSDSRISALQRTILRLRKEILDVSAERRVAGRQLAEVKSTLNEYTGFLQQYYEVIEELKMEKEYLIYDCLDLKDDNLLLVARLEDVIGSLMSYLPVCALAGPTYPTRALERVESSSETYRRNEVSFALEDTNLSSVSVKGSSIAPSESTGFSNVMKATGSSHSDSKSTNPNKTRAPSTIYGNKTEQSNKVIGAPPSTTTPTDKSTALKKSREDKVERDVLSDKANVLL